jgi:hypothetical protein
VWIFFIFLSNKIRVSPTGIVSSISPPQCRLSSDRCSHAATLYYASFSLSQDEFAASALFVDNVLFCRLSSQAKSEALNLHHRCRLPSPDRPTPPPSTVIKKLISTLPTLSTIQPHLHFASLLVKASHHQSSTQQHPR